MKIDWTGHTKCLVNIYVVECYADSLLNLEKSVVTGKNTDDIWLNVWFYFYLGKQMVDWLIDMWQKDMTVGIYTKTIISSL